MATTLLQQIDGQLDQLFSGWNVYSTCLAVVIVVYLFSPLFLTSEADTHPLLLARQAVPSAVRQPGESAVYRSLEAPHGYPLRSGLDIKDAGNPRWAPGRDGDLRDIWREALREVDPPTATEGRILSAKGRNEPVSHDLKSISKEINIIGKSMQAHGGTRVAIYLPNSIEFVTAFFAAAFYGIAPVLISQNQPHDLLAELLRNTHADILIVPAGTLSPQDIKEASPRLKHIIWVVEHTSREMDWDEGPPTGGNVSEWHQIIDQNKENAGTELPSTSFENGVPSIISVWQNSDVKDYEIVEFSQQNIIAGVAAQIHALPPTHRLSSNDVLLPLEPLTLTFPLTLFLAALHSHATIALTTVAGSSPDFALAFQRVNPTIVICSSNTLSDEHARQAAKGTGLFDKILHAHRASSLATGSMRHANNLPLSNNTTSSSPPPPKALSGAGGPRLIYTSARAGADTAPLSPAELTTLRVRTSARIVHALTAARVAGAVAQSNMLDYRTDPQVTRAHFGAPVSALEIRLVEGLGTRIPDDELEPVGIVVAAGPAAVGGEANLGVKGRFGDDNCLVLV